MARANHDLAMASTPAEREAAESAFLEAERDHLGKIGVVVPTTRTVLLPAVLVLVLLVTLVIGFLNSRDTADLVRDNAAKAYATCLQTNDSRAANVRDKRQDVKNLKSDLRNLRSDIDFIRAVSTPGPEVDRILRAKRNSIQAKTRAITSKRVAIAQTITAVQDTAIAEGSVRVRCTFDE
jgi:hypothetical protein